MKTKKIKSVRMFDLKSGKLAHNMYLWGDTGIGKTYKIKELMQEIKDYNATCKPEIVLVKKNDYIYIKQGGENDRAKIYLTYLNVVEETLKIRESGNKESEKYTGNYFKDKSVLVLDDIGAESIKGNEMQFYELLDYRLQKKLKTYFISNMSLEQLERHYANKIGDKITAKRICDRIGELIRYEKNGKLVNLQYNVIGENKRRAM